MDHLVEFVDHEGRTAYFWPRTAVVYTTHQPVGDQHSRVIIDLGEGRRFFDGWVPSSVVLHCARQIIYTIALVATAGVRAEDGVIRIPAIDATFLSALAGSMSPEQTSGV